MRHELAAWHVGPRAVAPPRQTRLAERGQVRAAHYEPAQSPKAADSQTADSVTTQPEAAGSGRAGWSERPLRHAGRFPACAAPPRPSSRAKRGPAATRDCARVVDSPSAEPTATVVDLQQPL